MSFSWGQIHVWCWHNITCYVKLFSRVQLFATLWTVAHQAPLSMEFFRQEYWSGLPCPPPGDCLDPGIQPTSPGLCIAGGFFTHWAISTCYPGTQWGEFTSGEFALYTWDLEIRAIFSLENWDMARKKKPEWTSVTVSGLFCFSLGIILWF